MKWKVVNTILYDCYVLQFFFGDRRLQECFYFLAMLVSKLNISVIVGLIPCRKNKGDIKREGKIEYQTFF